MSENANTMLEEVNKAIYTVLIGGQSYKIGSRELTRADLKELQNLRQTLENEVQSSQNSDFAVAFFEGR